MSEISPKDIFDAIMLPMTWFYYAVACAIFVSLASVSEKRVLKNEHSIEFATLLSIFVALLSIPILVVEGMPQLSWAAFFLIYLVAALGSVAYVCVTKAMRHLSISLITPLFLLGPVITTIFAFVFLGERIGLLQALGIFSILIGCYVLERKGVNGSRNNSKYLIFVLIALVLYGATALLDKMIISNMEVPILQYLAVVQILIAINILIIRYFSGANSETLKEGVVKYGLPIFAIALCTIAYRYFQFQAYALASIGMVAAVKHSSSLFTTIIGGEIFHEEKMLGKTAAVLLMLLGAVLILIK